MHMTGLEALFETVVISLVLIAIGVGLLFGAFWIAIRRRW